jgi:pimeloyl-ACP methyl ester carboxylesterase
VNVALVGGFGAPPALLRPLRDAVRGAGHNVRVAPLGLNLDCGEATVQRVDAWIRDALGDAPVALVGHSRGGHLGRVIAVRRPDTITRLVTIATPWTIGPPARPGVAAVAGALRALRRRGLNVMGSLDCATGSCCVDYRRDVAAKPAARWSALWSSTDRFAGDDARPPREADNAVDLRTGHVGAVTNAAAIARIVGELR